MIEGNPAAMTPATVPVFFRNSRRSIFSGFLSSVMNCPYLLATSYCGNRARHEDLARYLSRPESHRISLMFTAKFISLMCLCLVVVPRSASAQAPSGEWQSLFDGKTLGKWQSTKFGGEGAVKVENGQVVLEAGRTLTGV